MQRRPASPGSTRANPTFPQRLESAVSVLFWLTMVSTPLIAVGVLQLDPRFVPNHALVAYPLVLCALGVAIAVGWLAALATVDLVSRLHVAMSGSRLPRLKLDAADAP